MYSFNTMYAFEGSSPGAEYPISEHESLDRKKPYFLVAQQLYRLVRVFIFYIFFVHRQTHKLI